MQLRELQTVASADPPPLGEELEQQLTERFAELASESGAEPLFAHGPLRSQDIA
jgi:hypothetical protein